MGTKVRRDEEVEVEATDSVVDALTSLADASSGEEAAALGDELLATLGERAGTFDSLIKALARRADEMDALRQQAGSDPLTGLANRRVFYDAVQRATAEWHRSRAGFAVLLLDMDGLKDLNDTHGHAAGDEALCAIAEACRQTCRTSDLVARIGGDEFAVLLTNVDEFGAGAAASRYQRVVEAQQVRGQDLQISVGVALPNAYTPTADDVIAAADRSMYEDKRARKSERVPSPTTPPGLAA